MGQLNKSYLELDENLKSLGEETLKECHSPEEIAILALKDVGEANGEQ